MLHHFNAKLADIERDGVAEVTLAGRSFTIRKDFVEDAGGKLKECIASLRKALLVMHAPTDQTVGIENATAIFTAARHPKSFVSLDKADHLLSNPRDAAYAAEVIAAWASRYLPQAQAEAAADEGIVVAETGAGKFQNMVTAGRHHLLADEPAAVGGLDSGPNPYDYLAIALGACTSMTLRIYAEHKKLAPAASWSASATARWRSSTARTAARRPRAAPARSTGSSARSASKAKRRGAGRQADRDRRQVSGASHAGGGRGGGDEGRRLVSRFRSSYD